MPNLKTNCQAKKINCVLAIYKRERNFQRDFGIATAAFSTSCKGLTRMSMIMRDFYGTAPERGKKKPLDL